MGMRRSLLLLTWLGLTATGLVVLLSGLRASRVERQTARPVPEEPEASPYPALPPPSPRQVREALERVFGDVLAGERQKAVFCVADLNGDGSEDLAAAAKPRANRLKEINAPFANWTIQDAEHPPSRLGDPTPRRPEVMRGDGLLAVIHGEGASGWRDREARQAYLVRNGAGLAWQVRRPQELAALSTPGARLPRIVGDVLLQTGPSAGRFLYWTGARYLWHSPGPAAAGGATAPHG